MAYDKIKKNVYYDPPDEYPHSSRNHYEDFQDYHLPLNRMHHASVHDRGIANGLETSGAPGAAEVVINAGVAVDGSGQFIVLSDSGHGDIGTDPPNGDNDEQAVPVHLPLITQAGKTVYVTIQFSQILRAAEGSGGRMEQVPWLRLQPTSGAGAYVDDGTSVILAIVAIDAGGHLTSLKVSDSSLTYGRASLGIPIGELRVRRSYLNANQAQETVSGKLKPGVGGGLQMTVTNAGDSIILSQEGDTNCNAVELRTGKLVCRDSAKRDIFHLDSGSAQLQIGAAGNGGDLLVNDQGGTPTLKFTSSDAELVLGGAKTDGNVIVRDAAGSPGVRLDGAAQRVTTRNINPLNEGGIIDVNARHLRVHGSDITLDGVSKKNNRALADSGDLLTINAGNDYSKGTQIDGSANIGNVLSAQGVPIMTTLTRKAAVRWLWVDNGTHTADVDLGSPRMVVAYVALVAIDPHADFDDTDAVTSEVYSIDGTVTTPALWGGESFGNQGDDANVHAPVWRGVAQKIRFRIRSFEDCAVSGWGIVEFE